MKEIKVKVYEYKILNKTYFVYVNGENEFTEFYLQQEGIGIIKFAIGIKLNETIEDFINRNIMQWVTFYDEDFGED